MNLVGCVIGVVCVIITLGGYSCCIAAGKEDERMGLK